MAELITGGKLSKICPNMGNVRAAQIADLINTICPYYCIDSKNLLEEALATFAHESGGFVVKVENLNYKTPQLLVNNWPHRFSLTETKGKLLASNYIFKPQLLGNTVYANRMGNGDIASGDGFRYRGGGFCGITGKSMYQRYADFKKLDLETAAKKVQSEDFFALDSACWVFVVEKKLLDEAAADKFRDVSYQVNGGFIGWDDRERYYKRCKVHL